MNELNARAVIGTFWGSTGHGRWGIIHTSDDRSAGAPAPAVCRNCATARELEAKGNSLAWEFHMNCKGNCACDHEAPA